MGRSLYLLSLVQVAVVYCLLSILSLKITNLFSYIILSSILAISTMIIVIQATKMKKISFVFFAALNLGLTLRSIHVFSAGPNILPLSDSYADFAYSKVVYNTFRAPIIPNTSRVEAVSQWPLLHVLTAILAHVTGLKITWLSSFAIPLVFWVMSFTVIYLFTKFFMQQQEFDELDILVVSIATMIFALLTHAIYESIQFIRGNFGLIWIHIILYLLLKLLSPSNLKKPLVITLIICSIAFVFSHHYSVGTFLIFLVLTYFTFRMPRPNPKKKNLIESTIRNFLIIFLIGIAIWWIYYAIQSFKYASTRLHFLYHISYQYKRQFERSVSFAELRPPRILIIVLFRDIVIYGLIGISCFRLLLAYFWSSSVRNKLGTLENMLSIMLISLLADFVIVSSLIGGADKVIAFFAPLLIATFVCATLRTHFLKSYRRLILMLILVSSASIGAFLAPYSHNYAPIYLYDDSVRPEATNGHNSNFWAIQKMINEYSDTSVHYLSDDNELLFALVEPERLQMICDYDLQKYAYSCKPLLLIRFGDYPAFIDFWYKNATSLDKVYSAGLPEIYIIF